VVEVPSAVAGTVGGGAPVGLLDRRPARKRWGEVEVRGGGARSMKSEVKSGARRQPCAEEKAEQRWSSVEENRRRRGAHVFKGAREGGARGGGDAPRRAQSSSAGRMTHGARGIEIQFKTST
jgi:hypothetical protein